MKETEFDCGYSNYAKEKHAQRVAQNGNRVEFAKQQFEKNNIEYALKNEAIGHFHAWRKSDGRLFQFWAGTGKILGEETRRGIADFIAILKR